MRIKTRQAILFSGILWLGIGILLLTRGIQYLVEAGNNVLNGTSQGFSLTAKISEFTKNPEQAALILISAALLLGLFKGRVVFKKTVNRVVHRICSQPSPLKLGSIYSKGYICLIVGMSMLGMSLKVFPIPLDVKGFMDFTIGSALINGAMLYFRAAMTAPKKIV